MDINILEHDDFLKDMTVEERAAYEKLDAQQQHGCFKHWMATEGHHLNYTYLAELFGQEK